MLALREQPNQFVAENQKDAEWFINNVRYVAEKYNTQQNNLGYRNITTLDKPVDEMLRMFSYYLGKQDNRDYYYATQDQDNCDLPTVWINGQKLTSMIDFMIGNAIKMIQNIEPSVKATNKAIVNKKTKMIEMALAKFDLAPILEELEKDGIGFSPLGMEGDKKVEIPEDVYRYMEYDYKEYGEVIAQRMATDILMRNNFVEKYKQSFMYLLLGGVCGIENYIKNGKPVKEIILPYNLIWDNSVDDDMNTRAQFAGKVDWYTTGEILSNPEYIAYLTPQDIDEIKSMNAQNIDKMLGEEYITSNQLRWWYNYSGVPKVAAVTSYWIGYKEMRYERTKDQYGNEHFAKMRSKNRSKFWAKTVYKATLLANKYVVDFGEVPNLVRNPNDLTDVQLPISIFLPNMVMGETRSIASRLHKHQDRIDYLNNEITKTVNRAKGKVFILNKHKLGTSTAQEVLNDFERMGIHITDGNATGEDYQATDNNRIVEVVDMTLDPNVQQLIFLRNDEERIMEEIVNVPKVAMGQQQGYLGAKTQAGSIAQANLGTAYLYQGFIQFLERDLQFSLNQYKISLLVNEDDDIQVLDKRGVEYLKLTEDFKFEDFGVYIKVKDFIDEQAKERLLALAQAAMQNQMIDMRDFIKIETAKTYSELLNELEYAMGRKEREAKQQQQLQMMMQQAQMEQQMQMQQQALATKEQGANYRQELKVAADMSAAEGPQGEPTAVSETGAPVQAAGDQARQQVAAAENAVEEAPM